METLFLGLLAETSIHYGAETCSSAIDLPVAREASTQYPIIAGSAFKGCLRDRFPKVNGQDDPLVGSTEAAGQLIFSDLRLLLLPIRSLNLSYAWVTCPLILERLRRDMLRGGANGAISEASLSELDKLGTGQYCSPVSSLPKAIYLEERELNKSSKPWPADIVQQLAAFFPHDGARNRLAQQLVIVSNNDFSWFAKYALPVMAHNVLGENKQSTNLWYEEILPVDTLLYGMIQARPTLSDQNIASEPVQRIQDNLKNKPYLQIGAGETTGQGWLAVQLLSAKGA